MEEKPKAEVRKRKDRCMNVNFYELAVSARFTFGGQRFEKLAMNMARDEQGCGSAFMGENVVEADSDAPLLPPEEAARWKPNERRWTEYLSPAPGLAPGRSQ